MDLVVPVMLVAGALGGLVNKFLLNPVEERALSSLQHMLVGIAAAFTVPVLLNMISSTLIENVKGGLDQAPGLNSLLILAGFCLLAAISSRAFIRSLSDRILKDHVLREVTEASRTAKEAKAVAENAEAIAELSIEPEETATPQLESPSTGFAAPDLTPDEELVLRALSASRFTMRTVSGLARDSSLPRPLVNDILSQLATKGLLESATGRKGQTLWYATAPVRLALDAQR
jgi:hypothetical protein